MSSRASKEVFGGALHKTGDVVIGRRSLVIFISSCTVFGVHVGLAICPLLFLVYHDPRSDSQMGLTDDVPLRYTVTIREIYTTVKKADLIDGH